MKRTVYLIVPFLLAACGSPSQYSRECDYQYDLFDEFFTCVNGKISGDPRPSNINPFTPPSFNARNRAILDNYGEDLSSRVRQHLITDEQAKDLFADKAAELR